MIDRRYRTFVDGVIFRVVAVRGDRVVLGRRDHRATTIPIGMLHAAIKSGAIEDVTDQTGRVCPLCGAPLQRDAACVIESIESRVINGYHDRHKTERRTRVAPVWLCPACEHVEEG